MLVRNHRELTVTKNVLRVGFIPLYGESKIYFMNKIYIQTGTIMRNSNKFIVFASLYQTVA